MAPQTPTVHRSTVALTHGLTRAGFKVAAHKRTGTGSFGDVNDNADAGTPLWLTSWSCLPPQNAKLLPQAKLFATGLAG